MTISPYDVVIIGGGISGLSAASSVVRQNHAVLILDSGTYRNDKSSHMHTLPSWDHRNPADFRAAARKDLERYGAIVRIEQFEVATARQTEQGYFEVADARGETWWGRKLILATGVEDIMDDLPGYAECWVKGIFHCLYCHGWEERDSASSGILAYGDLAAVMPCLHFARNCLRLSKEVTLYTNGNEQLASDLQSAIDAAPAPMKADARKISRLTKGANGSEVTLTFEDGTEKTEGFLAHKPKSRHRGAKLAEQLGLELTPQGTIKVNPPFNQTSVRGVFAAGDTASMMPTVTFALASGTAAGGGAPSQLQADTYGQKPMF